MGHIPPAFLPLVPLLPGCGGMVETANVKSGYKTFRIGSRQRDTILRKGSLYGPLLYGYGEILWWGGMAKKALFPVVAGEPWGVFCRRVSICVSNIHSIWLVLTSNS
jgi:hypothetical protein